MNHLVAVDKDSNSNLVSDILLSMKNQNINYKESSMFIYCDFYAGDFWKKSAKKAA